MSKKALLFLITLTSIFSLIIFFKKNSLGKQNTVLTVGILQTASFPALDEVRESFITEIKKEFGEKVVIITQNAQGSLTQAQAIASSFHINRSIDVFFAIATPAVQALKSEIHHRPIVFAAVTDPENLRLRELNSNITGSTDMADIPKQISIIRQVIPHLNHVALIYNPAEPNSTVLVQNMKKELEKLKISWEEDGVNSQADVAVATQHAVKNAGAILIPTDNTVSSAFPIVSQIAHKASVPVVTTWTSEQDDALIQFGVDYSQSGQQAARLVKEIFVNGKKPAELQILAPESKILISNKALDILGLSLSDSLKTEVLLR